MKPFALGLIADLRSRRLLPIAGLLLVALVAVPLVLREPEAPPPAPPVPQPAAETVPGGLPSPDAALAGQALVTMASLETSSALRTFDSRDPFKPLQSMGAMAEEGGDGGGGLPFADGGDGGSLGADSFTAGSGSDSGGSPGSPGSGGETDSGGGPTTGGGDEPDSGDAPAEQPSPRPAPAPAPERLTYAADVSLAGPGGERRVRGLPRLAMLPSASAPLLIFLGVSDSGNDAIFLVDAKLTAESGEGECQPSPEDCATVELQPGEIQSFLDADGNRYVLSLDQIRAVDVADAARAREALSASAARSQRPAQRLVPLLVDVFTGGQ